MQSWEKGEKGKKDLTEAGDSYTTRLRQRGSNSVVECNLAKVEVAGSNPVSRSIYFALARQQGWSKGFFVSIRFEGVVKIHVLSDLHNFFMHSWSRQHRNPLGNQQVSISSWQLSEGNLLTFFCEFSEFVISLQRIWGERFSEEGTFLIFMGADFQITDGRTAVL